MKRGNSKTPSSAVQSCGLRRFSVAETRLGVVYSNKRFTVTDHCRGVVEPSGLTDNAETLLDGKLSRDGSPCSVR